MVFPSSGPSFSNAYSTSSSSTSSSSSLSLGTGRRKPAMSFNTGEQLLSSRKQKKRVPVLLNFNLDQEEAEAEAEEVDEIDEQRRGGHRYDDTDAFEEVPLVGLETGFIVPAASPAPPKKAASSRSKQQAKLALIESQAEQLRAASVASTRRMLAYCGQANEAGGRTMEMLATQGDQLRRVDGQLDGMTGNLGEARKNIREMERSVWSALFADFCCFSGCFCNSGAVGTGSSSASAQALKDEVSGEQSTFSANSTEDTASSRSWISESFSGLVSWKTQQQQQPNSQPASRQPIPSISGGGGTCFPRSCEKPSSSLAAAAVSNLYYEDYACSVSSSFKPHENHLEAELSANLTGVDHLLGGLRNMALDMDAEIGRQNRQLEGINRKAADNSAALGRAASAMSKLIEED